MSSEEAQTVVVLTTGSFETAVSPEELEKRLSRGGASPFQKIIDIDGREHWVNASQVVEMHDPAAHSSATFS